MSRIFGARLINEALGLPQPTDEQVRVVESPASPTLVVAGAGSGKTETMASRVLYVVANGWFRPDQILGLTFTRKAAGGLGNRIRARLRALALTPGVPDVVRQRAAAGDPTVSTYHAFGGSLIGEFGPLMGWETRSRVLTPTASWQLARSVVARWDGDLLTDLRPEQVTEQLLALAGGLSDHLSDTTALATAYQQVIAAIELAPPSPRQRSAVRATLQPHLKRLNDRLAVLPLIEAFAAAKKRADAIDYADQMALAARLAVELPMVGEQVRDRHRLVLLDEYQDTGHAQRVILRALFGRDPDHLERPGAGHPVMAVGDPVQSIYSWRGASAANLPRFVTDFPAADGGPADRLTLSTSFRNAVGVLDLANVVSAPVRSEPVPVPELGPRDQAPSGTVRYGLFETAVQEDAWVADGIVEEWDRAKAAGREAPTTAVLLRRRADMEPLARELRSRGLPVEVVGLGGLLSVPEVADLLSLLRVLVDPTAGDAAVRLLTGARWRLGMADLDRLSRRATALSAQRQDSATAAATDQVRAALLQAGATEDVDNGSLIDALSDPGPAEDYTHAGRVRIDRLAAELTRLRGRLHQPLTELLTDLEHTTGLDVEVQVHRPDGRVHLDAFAAIVGDLADAGAGPTELLEYLAVAEEREDGLTPGEPEPVPGQVQIMTLHAAKGLEWEVVAVPHLVDKVFPSGRNRTWLSDPAQPPPVVRGDRDDLPALQLPVGGDQKHVEDALNEHAAELKELIATEERRLFYVAITRAEQCLLLSGHHWGRTGSTPAGPSPFLLEVDRAGLPLERVAWADPPTDDTNPVTAETAETAWPVDPLGSARQRIEQGADLVLKALAGLDRPGGAEDPSAGDPTWSRDVGALLAERDPADPVRAVPLPGSLSVTGLVELAADPEKLARRISRPVPRLPSATARRGTEFHRWLERWYGGEPLLELTELPGAGDADAALHRVDPELQRLREAFLDSSWAGRTPVETELGFSLTLAGLPVRGRVDAVFTEPDGSLLVVDWKTGPPTSAERQRIVSVQLAVYRLAVAALYGVSVRKVRAAFVHIAHQRVVSPVDLLSMAELEELIRTAAGEPDDTLGEVLDESVATGVTSTDRDEEWPLPEPPDEQWPPPEPEDLWSQ